jgi:hypothetical protein
MRKLFAELLKDVSEVQTLQEKAAILRSHPNEAMVRKLLLAALDPTVEFDVQIPSYKENNEEDGYASNSLFVEYRRIYIFLKSYKEVRPERKKQILEQILESIDPSDAVALVDVLKKDLSKYGMTKEVANAAFPGLIK